MEIGHTQLIALNIILIVMSGFVGYVLKSGMSFVQHKSI